MRKKRKKTLKFQIKFSWESVYASSENKNSKIKKIKKIKINNNHKQQSKANMGKNKTKSRPKEMKKMKQKQIIQNEWDFLSTLKRYEASNPNMMMNYEDLI